MDKVQAYYKGLIFNFEKPCIIKKAMLNTYDIDRDSHTLQTMADRQRQQYIHIHIHLHDTLVNHHM